MKDVAIQFLASMVQVFLISLQTVNVINKNIPLMGITSIGISLAWMVGVAGVTQKDWRCKTALALGGSAGAMLSIPFYDAVKFFMAS